MQQIKYVKVENAPRCIGQITKNHCEWCQDCQKDDENLYCPYYEHHDFYVAHWEVKE